MLMKLIVKTTGRENGAANGTYYAAYVCFFIPTGLERQCVFRYVYFEKVRILEGKKKTPKRTKCEIERPNGYALENAPRYIWAIAN